MSGGKKSAGVAYALWAVGCIFGVHRAYLGRPLSATAMALLSVAGAGMLIASVSGVLGGYLEMAQLASGGASAAANWAQAEQTQDGARWFALGGGGIFIVVLIWCVADLFLIPKMTRAAQAEH